MLLAASTLSIAVAVGANATIVGLATSLIATGPTARGADGLVDIRMGSGSHVSHREWRDPGFEEWADVISQLAGPAILR